MSDSPLFLGLDLSTQQLKAIIITSNGSLKHETAVNFDRDLPQHGTTNGSIHGEGKGEVTSPVAMWVDAVDLLLERMKSEAVEFGRIRGVSGAGQQHGSVYWSTKAEALLANLDPSRSLAAQLCPDAFSIAQSPIWQDSSTKKECAELNEAVGGAQALADLSGSRAYERFTGPQIAKIRKTNPAGYNATTRISLVSSFIASLFLGSFATIEVSDASGMNLMNVLTHCWDDTLLNVCGGPDLRVKLGDEPAHGGSFLGKVSSWWVQRWGFDPGCGIAPFTGDNPASMVSLSSLGDAVLSLGTSTTLLLDIPSSAEPAARFTTSHLLAHPASLPTSQATGLAEPSLAMLCYKNGALAREQVRNTYCSQHWHIFNEYVEASPPGNKGLSGLYFPLVEIIPPGVHGTFLFKDGKLLEVHEQHTFPEEAHARAILESQFLSIKARIAAILHQSIGSSTSGSSASLKRLILTGGSSQNTTIRQLAADLFGLPAYVAETKEAAGHGGALLALFAWWRLQTAGTFSEMKGQVLEETLHLVAEPRVEVTSTFEKLVQRYQDCEDQVVKICFELSRLAVNKIEE